MEDIDEQIIKHKNNIINATNKIKEIKNINELNEINNSIKLENEFLFSLMSIKSKIGNIKHSPDKQNRENFENNDIDLKSENTEIVKKKQMFKNNNNRAKSNYKKETTNIEIKVNNYNPESDHSFNYYFNDIEIYSKYIKKSQSKNFIYFEYSKNRNGCNDIIRYEKNTKKLIIKNECLNKIEHDTITFDKFLIVFQNDNTNFYNMKLIKIQKFYVRYLYKFPIDLSNTQINYEKHKAFGTINSLDFMNYFRKFQMMILK